ncbi:MAG: imidazole glycerol phosphate synthase subunit HisH [Myxococcota bacterium]
MKVKVVETEISNLASVKAGLRRAGGDVEMARSMTDLEDAEAVVLPGVGAFRPAMERLRAIGLAEGVRQLVLHAAEGRGPRVLAVCLGYQLLGSGSEEAADTLGLQVHDGRFYGIRASSEIRVPHLGWNRVHAADGPFVRDGDAYFAHSYALNDPPAGWHASTVEHGGRMVAALEKGRVLGTQFHPELSGAWGRSLLERWLKGELAC